MRRRAGPKPPPAGLDRAPGEARAASPGASTPLGSVLQFMRALWAVDHALQSTSKRMDAEIGVTGPQRLAIRIVGRFPWIAAGTLADVLCMHPSTLTGVLQRLCERGILERRADPEDARRALFRLTARGRELDAVRRGTVEAAVQRVIARAPRAQVAAAQAILGEIADALAHEPKQGRAARAGARPRRVARAAARRRAT